MSNQRYTPDAGSDRAGPTVSTDDDTLQYGCPHCDAVYDTELLARVHVTRADDPDHRPHNGMVAACEIPIVDTDGRIVEHRSRQPDEIDLTAIERGDFPDSLTDKRRTALVVASRYPQETNREQLTTLIEEWTTDTPWDAPSSWTVGRALNAFYQPDEPDTESDSTKTEESKATSVTELEPLQQAIVICRIARPELSQTAIGRRLDCAESYPSQVLNTYEDIHESLATQADETSLEATLNDVLTPAARETLVASTPITAVLEEDLLTEQPAPTNGAATDTPSPTSTQITGQWGSPVDDDTPLSAAPTLATESTADTPTAAETAVDETTEPEAPADSAATPHDTTNTVAPDDEKVPETTPVASSAGDGGQAVTTAAKRQPATDTTARLIELKTRVETIEDLVDPLDDPSIEAQMLVNLANIVETACDELIDPTE